MNAKILAVVFSVTGTVIVVVWGFVLTTAQTNAKMPNHEARILSLEQLNYRMDERYKFIQQALVDIKKTQQDQLAKGAKNGN